MKLHSRTEKVTFFLEELCEIFCKQWGLLGLIAIVWLSTLALNESILVIAFFTGFHTAVTVIIVSTMFYEAKLTAKTKHWYNVSFMNNVTGQKYTLVLPPTVAPDIYSVAKQIKGQF